MENKYTEEEIILFASMLRTGKRTEGFIKSMKHFKNMYPDSDLALEKFFAHHFSVFPFKEFFDLPLDDMPLYISNHKALRAIIATWRLKLGK